MSACDVMNAGTKPSEKAGRESGTLLTLPPVGNGTAPVQPTSMRCLCDMGSEQPRLGARVIAIEGGRCDVEGCKSRRHCAHVQHRRCGPGWPSGMGLRG